MLEIDGLTAGYGGATVLRDVSLTVGQGEIVAMLGANGAGKTTLLRAVFGLLAPFRGEITMDGVSTIGRPAHRSAAAGVGFVPEGRALAPSLTVDENLRIVDKWKVDPYRLFPELEFIRRRKVGLLSGGEQQMLAVGRALASGPSVLLVDELSFGLAPLLVGRLLARLRTMADEQGLAVLLVEQHVHHALEVADRAYVLAHGELVLHRKAEELRADPELLAAAYLGRATPRTTS